LDRDLIGAAAIRLSRARIRAFPKPQSDPPAAPEHTPDLAQDEDIAQELEHAASEFRWTRSAPTAGRASDNAAGRAWFRRPRSLVEEFVASAD
jgi:hypothetical protein